MTSNEKILRNGRWNPFLWMSILCLGGAISLARLNSYLGKQVNYLDHLSLFNTLKLLMLTLAGISIVLGIKRLWKTRFKSISLMLITLTSSTFLVLMLFVD